jgi:hypothetical protein
VSLHTSQHNEQLNPQLPHESSSTENYLNAEAAEQRQQVTFIFLKMSTPKKYAILELYSQSYVLIYAQIYFIDLN